jgi:hypothetical protein
MRGVQASPIEEEVWVRTKIDNGAVILEVSDKGCGIKQEHRAKVFQSFSTKETGTGLGLSVSKKIIKAHGAKIDFYQNSPKGTTLPTVFRYDLLSNLDNFFTNPPLVCYVRGIALVLTVHPGISSTCPLPCFKCAKSMLGYLVAKSNGRY